MLLKIVNRAEWTDFYTQTLSYGLIHNVKLPSLDEFLEPLTGATKENDTTFDENTDKLLEEHALKRLKEMQNGR